MKEEGWGEGAWQIIAEANSTVSLAVEGTSSLIPHRNVCFCLIEQWSGNFVSSFPYYY